MIKNKSNQCLNRTNTLPSIILIRVSNSFLFTIMAAICRKMFRSRLLEVQSEVQESKVAYGFLTIAWAE